MHPSLRGLVLRYGAIFLFCGALTVFFAAFSVPASHSETRTHGGSIANGSPEVTAITVNNGSAITLTPNATTTIYVNYTVTDYDGCGEVFYTGTVTTTLFRSGASTTCAVADPSASNQNTLFCYVRSTSTHSCPSATSTQTSANVTTTFDIWYFAQGTDASSSYPSETWQAFVIARDASSTTNSTTSIGVELNSLLAITTPTSTLSYGTVYPNTNTSGTNQASEIKNAGNASTTLRINGTALTSGGNSIPTSSQHYATSTFTFGGNEQQLQESATDVSGFNIPRPPMTSWAATAPLPSALNRPSVLTYNSHLYVIGGDPAGALSTSTVSFVSLNANGSLGSWSTTTPLPSAQAGASFAAAYNGFVYYVGGRSETTTVFFAPINTTGSIGAWMNTTPLPSALTGHVVLAHNGYLYVLGGYPDSIETSTVLFASINATGSISSWATTTPLPGAIYNHAGAVHDNRIYITGGFEDTSFNATSAYAIAAVNATGSLGAWAAGNMPIEVHDHGTAINGGILYTAGGDTTCCDGSITSTVQFAPIRTNGSLDPFSLAAPLFSPLNNIGFAVWNGYFYIVGGLGSGTTETTTVQYVSLSSRNTYWGLEVPNGTSGGSYSGTHTYTAVFSP